MFTEGVSQCFLFGFCVCIQSFICYLFSQARQFTDLAGFTLRCLVCGKALTGQTDAQSHAKATGHINFGEV